jgi:glycosyltransferase involved in cell wall biosynthesis
MTIFGNKRNETPMHILHISPYYAPAYAYGGVVRAVEGMAQATHALGHQVTVLTTDTLNQHGERIQPLQEMLNGVQVIRAKNLSPYLRGKFNLSTPLNLKALAQSVLATVDVVHLHEFRTIENILLTPHIQRLNIPMVLSAHGTLATHTGRSTLKRQWDAWFSPQIAQRIHAAIALTEPEAEDIRRLFATFWKRQHPLNIPIIPNGVNAEEFASLPDAHDYRQRWNLGDSQVIVFMGRLHPRKGAVILLKAFLQANLANTKLLMVGGDEGDLANLQALADERVVLAGYLNTQDRLGALACADVFVLPAVGEGLSLAVLEALASGVPVILSPECYLPIVEEEGAGWIVAPEIDDLAQALTRYFSDATPRISMRMNAKRLIEEQFTWAEIAQSLEKVYLAL